ncbi:MAG: dihydropteroate synthase, partial [Thermoleophilaceae bacterium]|nr:dihydropteroate synthase [Thermoleophilaceae bacterium]
ASIVNDVSGLADPEVADVCARGGARLVITHTTVPPKVKGFPGTGDVRAFFEARMELAAGRGVPEEAIVLDPGSDLGKTPAETVAVLRMLPLLGELGRPLLLAVSHKDFVGAITGRPPKERLAGTLAAVGFGVEAGASILRVHDVPEVRDYLAVRAALRGEAEAPEEPLAEGLRRASIHRAG